MKLYLSIISILLFFLHAFQPVAAQTVAEIDASKDNTLYENKMSDEAISNGAGQHFFVGVNGTDEIRRGILQFDLADIPAGSQIESVELRLTMTRAASTAPKTLEVFEVSKDWGEGTSDGTDGGRGEGRGGDATTGDVTWEHTFYPDETWDNPGGDFGSSTITDVDVADTGVYTWPSTPEFVALVQKWLDNPSENYGLIILGDEETASSAKRFSTLQNDNVEERPVLIVEYSGEVTSVNPESDRPDMVRLNQNYPNPFNPTTTISFSLPEVSDVELAVHDMLGRQIRTVLDGRIQAGEHNVTFDASNLTSGVYIYTLKTGDQMLTRRFTVLK